MFTKQTTLACMAAALMATQASAVVVGSSVVDFSSEFNNNFAAGNNTVNSSGLDTSNANPFLWTHDNGGNAGGGSGQFWHNASNENPDDTFITYDLGANFDVNSVLVWNFNVNLFSETDRGFNQFDLLVAADGVDPLNAGNFTQVITDGNLARADGSTTLSAQVLNVAGQANGVRYIRIEADTNHGSAAHTGLSEVRFDVVPEPGSLALLGLVGLALVRRR